MAINFPDSPTLNQTFSVGDITWKWDGSTWKSLNNVEELQYLSGLTSNVQTQIDTVQDNVELRPLSQNYVINGAFDIWQRGTSGFNTSGAYTADRWQLAFNGSSAVSASQQSALGTGLSGLSYLRYSQTLFGGGQTISYLITRLEDVTRLSGKQITLSFYAKASTNISFSPLILQRWSTLNPASDSAFTLSQANVTTNWQRFSMTVTLDSSVGKTIEGNHHTVLVFALPINAAFDFDIWGVQIEEGTVATQFRRSASTLQEELAACQRYYWRNSSNSVAVFRRFGTGQFVTSTVFLMVMPLPVQMRATPTISTSGVWSTRQGDTQVGTAAPSLVTDSSDAISVGLHSTVSGATAGFGGYVRAENSATTWIEFISEL